MQAINPTSPLPATETDRNALGQIAHSMIDACPDLRQMARDIAQTILNVRTNSHLEPDTVYWHRFSNTQSSARTFTGWQHSGPPVQSLTLPQLVMHRFNPHDQDATDELQQMGGFYTADAHTLLFDETNEVRLLPLHVLEDFWAVDFRTQYFDKLNAFWQQHPDDFRVLAKSNFIIKALSERLSGWLTAEDYQTVMAAIGVDLAEPVSLAMLNDRKPSAPEAQILTFDVVGYEATDIVRIVLASGRQILYLPGEIQCFHGFATPEDLHWWLMSQTNQAENRTRFMSHFAQASHAEDGERIGLHNALDLLFSTWGSAAKPVINQHSSLIIEDVFDHLRNAAKNRMYADAETSLRSNSDLRKQMWIAYLGAFNRVFGPLAALDWPIALAVVGAGMAETGLNVEHAINGHTTAQRKAGAISAILSGLDTLLNSTLLIHASPLLSTETAIEAVITPDVAPTPEIPDESPTPEPEPVPETELAIEEMAPGPVYPVQRDDLLAPFDTNKVLDAPEPLQAEGKMKGIYLQNDGSTYISIAGMPYAVRYVDALQGWVIIDPQNPFSFYRNMPVRLNESGIWEPIARPGLNGGGKSLGKLSRGRSSSVYSLERPLPSPYDVPEDLRERLREPAENEGSKYYDDFRLLDETEPDPFEAFEQIRNHLRQDAEAFYRHLTIAPRPTMPELGPEMSAREFLENSYSNANGLVIGESHSSIASKQLLIENMPNLARLKVKTLYLEHLLTDFHQADLDAFARSGRMSSNLKAYVRNLDRGHATDPSGRYTFMKLIKSAHENRIRIQAIDCMASYRIRDLDNPTGNLRQQLMNYFSSTIIRANQARRGEGRWIALMGNTHVNNFEGVVGVADLEGAIGLRVEDVTPGSPVGFDLDPGLQTRRPQGRGDVEVRSDIRLRAATKVARPGTSPIAIEQRLPQAGDFTINRMGARSELVHRSPDGAIVRTPIHLEDGHCYLIRPNWPNVSARRFDSFQGLSLALRNMGLGQVD